MQSRIIPKPNGGMARGDKRGLDTNSEDGAPDRKRPALASVIVEALKVDSLQKLCSSLEPVLRRVVSEEVERALAKLGTAKLSGRPSPKRIEATDGKNLQLQFRTKLSLPLFTGGKVEGEQNATIHVVLIDANTGQIITTGPESSAKLDIVVLEGDFNNEEEEGWTGEEFDSHVVKEREGKRPLLTGELQVTLKEGVGILGDLTFTDNSSWIRSRKFRLGLKVSPGCCEDIRIREAKTDAFTVKDHRGELYKKHYPPALQDEVWRLEKIGKDGSFHKRLNKAGIYSVEDFLRLVVRDSQRLRNILGSGMSNKMWDILVEHAKTCVLSGNHYIYYSDDPRNFGVVFNNIYELTGLIAGEQYHPADTLSDSQKVFVDSLVKKAYENWMHVIEYDGKSLLSFTQNKGSAAPQSDSMIVSQSNSVTYDYQMNLPSLPPSVPQEQPSISPGQTNGGYENAASRFPLQSHGMNVNSSIHINSSSLPIHNHNHLLSASSQVQSPMNANLIAVGQSQPSLSNFHAGSSSSVTSYRGFEDVVPEEDIRLRSHEMLENEDMQQLLRMFNMGGSYGPNSQQVPMNVTENNYHYNLGYMPNASANYGFEEDRTRSSGKAVVGWLKLKAALRWGIFVRKKAAERRAQIVDLDES